MNRLAVIEDAELKPINLLSIPKVSCEHVAGNREFLIKYFRDRISKEIGDCYNWLITVFFMAAAICVTRGPYPFLVGFFLAVSVIEKWLALSEIVATKKALKALEDVEAGPVGAVSQLEKIAYLTADYWIRTISVRFSF